MCQIFVSPHVSCAAMPGGCWPHHCRCVVPRAAMWYVAEEYLKTDRVYRDYLNTLCDTEALLLKLDHVQQGQHGGRAGLHYHPTC